MMGRIGIIVIIIIIAMATTTTIRNMACWLEYSVALISSQSRIPLKLHGTMLLDSKKHSEKSYQSMVTLFPYTLSFPMELRFFAIYFALFGVSGIMILILGSLVLPNVTVSTTLNEWAKEASSTAVVYRLYLLSLRQRMIFCWLLALFPLAAVFIFNMVPPCPRSDVIPGTPWSYTIHCCNYHLRYTSTASITTEDYEVSSNTQAIVSDNT